MADPTPILATVLRQPSPDAVCTCRHWPDCDCGCHSRRCDPGEDICTPSTCPTRAAWPTGAARAARRARRHPTTWAVSSSAGTCPSASRAPPARADGQPLARAHRRLDGPASPARGAPADGGNIGIRLGDARRLATERRWEADVDRTRVLIMGAAGRDFHDFNVVYRADPAVEVVAFTATQIPGIDARRYPAGAGRRALPGRHPHRPGGGPRAHHRRGAGRRGRLLLQRRQPRDRHARRLARAGRRRRVPPAGTGRA